MAEDELDDIFEGKPVSLKAEKPITPDYTSLPPCNSITECQSDFLILRIRANHTMHKFALGQYVITANSLVDDCKQEYLYAFGIDDDCGQYLSKDCVSYVIQLQSTKPISFNACNELLQKYLKKPYSAQSTKNLFQYSVARTQKARGLQVLTGLGMLYAHLDLIRTPLDPKLDKPNILFPVMVRPCPTKPRHGFVESRVVKTIKDINKILNETLTADPHGEVLLMQPIASDFSAVVTETAVVIGKGTDGATSGENCITIPCVSNLRYSIESNGRYIYRPNKIGHRKRLNALRYAGIQKGSGIFIETVGNQIVQLRTGPAIDFAGTRYSTQTSIKPKFVYSVTDGTDFLEYEKYLDGLKVTYSNEPWNVVIHHQNASLSSHYAVQAITRGFSVITDKKPSMLEHISFLANPETMLTVNAAYRKQLEHVLAISYPIEPTSNSLAWAVAVIQGLAAAPKTLASISLIVAAGIIIAKAGIALCLGEHRHFFRIGPGSRGYIALAPVSFPLNIEQHYKKGLLDRSSVYTKVFQLEWNKIETWQHMMSILVGVEADYRIPAWGGGYGGVKWAECTKTTSEIVIALMPFLLTTATHPVSSTEGPKITAQLFNVIAACNKLITISHNSAKCLTKIVNSTTLTNISNGYTGLRLATSPLTWELVK